MASNQGKCVVNGVTAATLRVLAMFSPASLRYKQLSGDVYRVSVPITTLFIITVFFMLALRIVNLYLFFSVMCDESIPNFSGISNFVSIGLMSWFISLGLLITITAIVRARKQMLRQIHFLNAIQKILSRFDLDTSFDSILRNIKINFTCSIFFLITLTILDITLSDENQSPSHVQHIMFYITLFINDTFVIMAGMQYFVIISIMVLTIKASYRFLLQYINHAGIMQVKSYSDKRVYINLPHREIRTFAGTFLSLCKMVNTINSSETILLLMVILSEISDIACHIYYLASAIQLPDTYMRTKEIAIQVFWILYVTARLFSRIENGHLLNNELQKFKEILCKILHKLPHNSAHTAEFKTLFEQVLLLQPHFAPLEIFTFNRTLIVSIISGSITFLIIILQFKIKETYSI